MYYIQICVHFQQAYYTRQAYAFLFIYLFLFLGMSSSLLIPKVLLFSTVAQWSA